MQFLVKFDNEYLKILVSEMLVVSRCSLCGR